MSQKEKRIEWIDTSKGIAIILVVMGHVVSSYHEAGLYLEKATVFNFFNQFVYSFHMALLMALSGYLYFLSSKKSKKNKKMQVLSKTISYGIPYIIFSVLWTVMKMALSGLTNSAITLKDLLLIPAYPISFMWFIYALMFMQIIQVVIGDLTIKGKVVHLILAGGGYCLQPLMVNWLECIDFSDLIVSDFLKFYLFYLMGVYLVDVVIDKLKNTNTVVLFLSFGLLVLGNVLVYLNILPTNLIYNFIIACIGVVCFINISMKLKRMKVLQYFGKQSLVIYVLQGFVIAATRIFLTKLHLNVCEGAVPLIICTMSAVVLPLSVYEISKRLFRLDFIFYPGRYINLK